MTRTLAVLGVIALTAIADVATGAVTPPRAQAATASATPTLTKKQKEARRRKRIREREERQSEREQEKGQPEESPKESPEETGGTSGESTGAAPELKCTAETESLATAKSDLATNGAIVCLRASASPYASLTISSGPATTNSTLTAAPGQHVVVAGVTIATSHVTVEGLHIKGAAQVGTGNVAGFHNDAFEWDEIYESSGDGVGLFAQVEGPTLNEYITIAHDTIRSTGKSSEGDGLHIQGAAHVTIRENNISQISEEGCPGCYHDDILQTYNTLGSEYKTNHDLVFEKNYIHDVDAEGFFLKDGDVTPNVTVRDNLSVRNRWTAAGGIWVDDCTHNLLIEKNFYPESSNIQAASANCQSPTVTLSKNIFGRLKINHEAGGTYAITSEHNIFTGSGQPEYSKGATDESKQLPESAYRCAPNCGKGTAADDDYELVSNPNGIGIDWDPGTQHYGPNH